jgi:hypothetical protein
MLSVPCFDDISEPITRMYPHTFLKEFLNFMRRTYILISILPQIYIMALLIGYITSAQYIQTDTNHRHAKILGPVYETFTEQKVRRQGFDHARNSIPHAVDPKDVALFESSDEEIDDTGISCETASKIRELTLACKELELKVSKYLKQTRHDYVDDAHRVL